VLSGTCSGDTAPWAPLISSAAAAVNGAPLAALNYYLVGPAAVATVQPPLLANLQAFAVSAGAAASSFISSFAASQLSCPAVSSLVAAASDAVCCTVYTPLYWYASVIFLLAWAYCCCGLPAAMLGRKRLVSRPWGDAASRVRGGNGGAGAEFGAAAAVSSRALAFAAPSQPPEQPPGTVDATSGASEAVAVGDEAAVDAGTGSIPAAEARKPAVVAAGAGGSFDHLGTPTPPRGGMPPPLLSPMAAYPPLHNDGTSASQSTAGLDHYRNPHVRASVRMAPAGVAAGAGLRRNSAASASSAASAARRALPSDAAGNAPPDAPLSPAVAAALAAVASASAVVAGSRAASDASSRRSSRASAPPEDAGDDVVDDPSPAQPEQGHQRRDSIEQHRRVEAFALPRVNSGTVVRVGRGFAAPDLDVDGGRF